MLLNFYQFFWNYAGLGHFNNPARTRCTYRRDDIQNFDPIEPTETDVFTIEFTQDLQNGRSASNPVFQCKVLSTDAGSQPDGNPSGRIMGFPNLSTSLNPVDQSLRTFANQKFGGFVNGNTYSINASVTTSDCCTVQRFSRVYCANPS